MEAQHTATPWIAAGHNVYQDTPNGSVQIAECVCTDVHYKEAHANAAFIVRACNAHDDLVGLTRLLLRKIDAASGAGIVTSDEMDAYRAFMDKIDGGAK